MFKLVAEFFTQSVGIVTGLVGAASGLGGSFPPLLLGLIRQSTGTFVIGFFGPAAFALACSFIARRVRPGPLAQPSLS